MRIIQEGKLYQLTFLPHFFPVNCYLVEEEDGLTLIDAGLPYSTKAILHAAEQIGSSIKRIVLTHAHSDHIGALDTLKLALPNAPLLLSRRDARLLMGDVSLDPDELQTPIKGGVPKPGMVKTKPDFLLTEGERIGSLLAVSAPGHTPGSMAFLDTRSGALIAGDAFQTRGGVAVSGQVQPLFPFPAMATWNVIAAVESARKLAAMNPTVLAIGHGELLRQPVARIQQSIKNAEQKLGLTGSFHVKGEDNDNV